MTQGQDQQPGPCPCPQLHLLAELEGHSDRAWHLAWNPRMPTLASCSTDKDVRLHSYSFRSCCSSSSSSSCKKDKRPSFNLREVIPTGHKRTVRQVAWSPTGRTLATASFDSTVGIWERIEDIERPDPPSTSAAGGGATITEIYDADAPIQLSNGGAMVDEPEWDCIGTLEGHESECKSVAFSHTGSVLASCSRDKSVWIWEVQPDAEFECLSVLMEHSQDVKVVAWHPRDEILASASYDDAIKLYIDDPSDDWFCFASLTGHTSTVWSLSFSPCGNYLASASDDKTVRIWRRFSAQECEKYGYTPQGKLPGRAGEKWVCVKVIKGYHDRTIYSVSWGVDLASTRSGNLGRIATAGGDGKICVLEVTEGSGSGSGAWGEVETRLVGVMEQAHGVSDVNCVAWAPASLNGPESDAAHPSSHGAMSDMLASAGDDGTVKVWTLAESVFAQADE